MAKAAADAAIAAEKQFLGAGAGYEYAAQQLTETGTGLALAD